MYTVGRLRSYITKGVYTVSGPFHPFGGAVDIIVVEQQDGSFKSSPWYVRFGKFQGVLKAKEKVVTISVDGVQADFHMYLDHKGEAYFLREVDCEEEGDSILSPSSSGEETDGQSSGDKRPMKSKNCNFDESKLVAQIDINNGKILTRTSSRRSRIMGLVFGRRSMKEDRIREEEDGPGVVRADSLERAEIAADLLEMKWSTNLASSRYKRNNAPQVSAPDNPGSEADKGSLVNEGHREMHSPLHDDTVNSSDRPMLHEETGILDSGMSNNSWVGFPKLESSDEDSGVEMSCLHTRHIIDECGVVKADYDENAKEITSPKPASVELDACPSKKLDGEQVSKGNILLPGNGLSEKCSVDRLEALSYSDSGGKKDETLFVTCREGAEVRVDAKTLHEIAELISEVNVQDTRLLVANEPLDFPETLVDGNCSNFFSGTSSNSSTNCILSETYTRIVTVDELNSVKQVESCSIYTVSGFDSSVSEVHDREDTIDEGNMNKLQYSSNAVADSQEFRGDSFSIGATNVPASEGSVEEQLLFGDLDDFNRGEVKCMESNSSSHVKKENPPSVASDCSEAEIESLNLKDEPHSSSDKFVQENMPNDVEDFREKSRIVSRGIDIPRNNKVAGEDFGRMAESLPNMWSPTYTLVVDDLLRPLGHSLDANPGSSMLTPLGINSDADKDDQVSLAHPAVGHAQISEELKDGTSNPAVGIPSEGINAPNGSWRVWPFSLKKSSSMKSMPLSSNSTRSSNAENTLESSKAMDGGKDGPKPKVRRKKVRVLTPTPEQLASLNLKEGKNTVTFTFSTSMLGPQQVDARIYLWKWDTRVVISDVDGTITKSDVLGQFMPLVGMDWSQTGVAHLFSSIKENGYQLLFLSARAISQAYHTRRFLFNLKQDGKALPDGPVVISPDGLFPSLFREVIRRAPHEFKIACLEDIKALFPSDRNPFYAGFGNRDTDEFSYLKVGIPKGKIFIINPKGEVVVNRRVDSKSYTSLHTLVHDMFPPMSSSEQEDFNTWNYWRLPPPPIDF